MKIVLKLQVMFAIEYQYQSQEIISKIFWLLAIDSDYQQKILIINKVFEYQNDSETSLKNQKNAIGLNTERPDQAKPSWKQNKQNL